MEKIWKSIRVDEETHNRVKVLAVMAGVTIDEFVGILADTYERSNALGKRTGPKWDEYHEEEAA